MSLQTYAPTRIVKTIGDSKVCITNTVGTVHRLQEPMLKMEMLKVLRFSFDLWVDQLKFLSGELDQWDPPEKDDP